MGQTTETIMGEKQISERKKDPPVFVREVFLVVCNAPLSVDGTTAADNARQAVGRVGHKGQQHPGMDGEVVHPLLGLLDERFAEHLPCEVFCDPVHLTNNPITPP